MTKRDQMLALLRVAEDGLAGLAAEAGVQRAYADAAALLEAARRVQQIGEQTHLESNHKMPVDPVNTKVTPTPVSAKNPPAVDRTGATKKPKKDAYPKFFRDGETLVKVGWSKSEKSEYEHKSPKAVLHALCRALTAVGDRGCRFTMEKVLPLKDNTDGGTLPDYQCYLCLAWLRQSGLVIQHGRQGYSLPKTGDIQSAIDRSWETLPVRS